MNDEKATKVGVGSSIATVGGITAAATGASAATMTGTLATIGGVLGGGMATGIGVVACAPVAIGGIAYGLFKWLND